ncbi:DUF456 domain-containing protein [Williamsia deligens]|uniref:DUF456 family protein n=1 Tax=Williamsia deligens TaxID=321325 RepID=A0ABW3G7W9_9NOCA|nr:DUF456 domain-containing protein [Williamsia deligens]MCP2194285.1 hypothetical protein [Williamsia deligens]
MPLWGDLLVALVIAVGLVGTVVPLLPGPSLVLGAIVVWAVVVGGWAWAVVAVAAVLIVGAMGLKYVVAGSSLRRSGIADRTIVIGGLVGIVGFFVVPVIGLPLGFLLGAAASEWTIRRDPRAAGRGAMAAARAALVAIGIELTASLFASGSWLIGAVAL